LLKKIWSILMTENHPIPSPVTNTRTLRNLALAAAILVYLLIVAGGVVSATGSGGACPDWPTCLGSWTPPAEQSALVNYAHRAATLLATLVVFASATLAWKRKPAGGTSLVNRSLYAAAGLMLIQILLGWAVSQTTETAWLASLHLGLSLLTLAAILVAVVILFYHPASAPLKLKLSFRSPFARLILASLTVIFVLLVSGALVKSSGASAACAGWPLCGEGLFPAEPAGWISLTHRLVVALAGALMLALFFRAWRTQRTQAPVLVAATVAAVLFISQALLGAQMVQGFPAYLLGLHQATATAVWGALIILVVAVGVAARSADEERADALSIVGRKGLARDLLMLTKPIVVALLLVTTYAGMVIAAQAWPSFSLTFWTLLGGFLAAGGSGAINQYIDRVDDTKMQRTQKRPIPAGRLTPAEGLAFGVGIALASFYLLTAYVNFLAALLSLAGIFYYVLLYSIFLKKTTVQNIVIGGGAGAIPPLVGWAAATGSLNIPSLFLFAIVFMWTPPHFWALALVRKNDYARAGVPMLPVVRGEKETRWQILIYTVELVGLTMLLPVFGLGGSVYLIGAVVLGGWLLSAAWKVWKQEGNKVAWKMYRYSSMYLAFLFVILMIDRLL
jgi:protoheme IX farnesyltransferase